MGLRRWLHSLIDDDPYPDTLTGLDILERTGHHPGSVPFEAHDPIDCWRCRDEYEQRLKEHSFISSMMIVCAECGNKRCPHATDHRLQCTGSNEPGQPGSVYS